RSCAARESAQGLNAISVRTGLVGRTNLKSFAHCFFVRYITGHLWRFRLRSRLPLGDNNAKRRCVWYMGYDKGRRGRGRDKRDGFGEEGFDPFADSGPPRFGGDDWRPAGGGDRFGGGNRFGGDRDGGGNRGGFAGGDRGPPRSGGGMPAQVVGTGTGKVKFFNTQKGFGFIQRDEGGEDVFVHISQVERAGLEGLAEGQELAFNLVDRGGK